MCATGLEPTVRKKVSLPAEKTVLSLESLRSRVDCDVDSLWCSEDYWRVYLLKHHNCRIKERLKIAIYVKICSVIRGVG